MTSNPSVSKMMSARAIGILLPNNQRQHRTLHIQKDVLPYALREMSAMLTSWASKSCCIFQTRFRAKMEQLGKT
jgi:hypothetical protein